MTTSSSNNNVLSSIIDGLLNNLGLTPKKSLLLKMFGLEEETLDLHASTLLEAFR